MISSGEMEVQLVPSGDWKKNESNAFLQHKICCSGPHVINCVIILSELISSVTN